MVDIVISDGVQVSVTQTLTINIVLQNDQTPVIYLDTLAQNTSGVFIEGNPISQPVYVAPRAQVMDRDSGMFPFHSALVVLVNTPDFLSESIDIDETRVPASVILEGNSTALLFYSHPNVSSGISQQAMQDLFRSVVYRNTAVEPSTEPRVIRFVVYDAIMSGVTASEASFAELTIQLTDDAPVVLLNRMSVMFTEGNASVQLSPDLAVLDVDSSLLSRAVIWFSNGVDLGLNFTVEFLMVSEESAQMGNLTVSFNPLDGRLEVFGEADIEVYQTVLRTLSYVNLITAGDPLIGNREVSIYVEGVEANSTSERDMLTILFEAIDNEPLVDLNGLNVQGRDFVTTFEEEGPAVYVVSRDAVLKDVDSTNLEYVRVMITNELDVEDEQLIYNSSVLLSVQRVNGSILITGPSPVEQFLDILLSLQYENSADEPSPEERTIVFEVSDGTNVVNRITTVQISFTNDPPVIDLNGGDDGVDFQTTYVEDGPAVSLTSGLVISDDGFNIRELRIAVSTLEPGTLIGVNESLYNDQTMSYIYSFQPPLPMESVQELLTMVQYHNPLEEPDTGVRTFCISVVDTDGSVSNVACSNVTVEPVNDNPPKFTESLYDRSATENEGGVVVIALGPLVSDLDSQNSETLLSFSIHDGDCANETQVNVPCPFLLDPTSGQLTTNVGSPPDFELKSDYHFVVEVNDGELSSVAIVSIRIVDVDDNNPVFTEDTFRFHVPQGLTASGVVGTIVATDADAGINANVTYVCQGGYPGMPCDDIFRVQPVTGNIILRQDENTLDPTIGQYILNVVAVSGVLGRRDIAQVCLDVSLNENDPMFLDLMYSANVSETVPLNSVVLAVSAVDVDEGSHGVVRYSINDSNVPFAVDPVSGNITVTAALDYELGFRDFYFTVTAQDTGRPVRGQSVNVRISVINVNEFPPVFNPLGVYNATVCEGVNERVNLVQLHATDQDADEFGTVRYFVHNSSFSVDVDTGIVTLETALDYEQAQVVSVVVEARDGGNLSSFRNITVYVLNVNDEPLFFPLSEYHVIVSENTSAHTAVSFSNYPAVEGDLCGMDQCENGIPLVDDPSCNATFPPLRYRQSTIDVPFIVNPETGIIYLTRVMDLETVTQKSYTFEVTVSNGALDDTTTIYIQLGDHNEFPPILEQAFYDVSVNESVPVATEVITVVATDGDAGESGVITYSLLGQNVDHFTIDSAGRVLTSTPLDSEAISMYNFTIVARDTSLSAEAALIIRVIDVNDLAPEFNATGYQFMVLENAPPGLPIGQVYAVDMDEGQGGQVTYSLTGPGSRYFAVDPESGVLVTNATFDREEEDMFSFYVVAVDQGLPVQSSSVQVTVTIRDDDDNPPSFSQVYYNVTLPEDVVVNQTLVTFSLSDPDDGANAEFLLAIVSGNEDGHFSLDAETRTLSVVSMLDYENIQSYTLSISASGVVNAFQQSIAVVDVTVMDVNDNPPMFAMDHNVSIPEHSVVGTLVAVVNAIDIDSGSNAAVVYAIQSVNPSPLSSAFAIDTTNGGVFVANQELIDRETAPFIALSVLASNPYFPGAQTASVSIMLTLIDINDHVPTFVNTSYLFIVDEDFTPVGDDNTGERDPRVIGSVVAEDADDPEVDGNGVVKYEIVGGNAAALFVVNSTSGTISAVQPLDREASAEHNLQIAAYDCNPAYPLNSTVIVKIVLQDINDNEPIFALSFVNVSISEAAIIGTPITSITAMDFDEAPNADIEFTLVSGDEAFTINPTSGVISVASELDHETRAEYLLTVIASDGTFAPTAEVLISVTDVNDNGPILSPLSVRVHVPEDTPLGSVVFNFSITDADAGNNTLSDLIFLGDSNGFLAHGNGSLVIVQSLNYEVPPNILSLRVFARNSLPPHEPSGIASVDIVTVNVNDLAPQLTLSRTVVGMDEDERSVALNPQAEISDGDGVNISTIASFKVMVVSNLAPQEVSTPFTPSMNTVPHTCLESKERKLVGCGFGAGFGFDYTEILSNIILMNQAVLFEGRVLILNGANQYARFDSTRVTSVTPSGGAISMFVWKTSHSTSRTTPMTILSKTTASTVHYALACDPDNALVYSYLGADSGSLERVQFPNLCEQLEGSWHHLAVVVLPAEAANQWRANVMVDAVLQASEYIQEPMDNLLATAYVGALEQRGNPPEAFFPGRISDLFISNGPVTRYEVSCFIGCGVAIRSDSFPPTLEYSFNYTSRTLLVEYTGTHEQYTAFIDSLVFVQPYVEPLTNPYVLEYTVNDGRFTSAPVQQEVNIETFNNHPPVVSTNGGQVFNTVFTEEGGPVPAVNTSAFILTDGDLVAFAYSVTVTITGVPDSTSEDVLRVVGVPSDMTLESTASELTLSGFLPIAEFRSVLTTLTYDNIADNPSGSGRTLVFTVNDSLVTSDPAQTIINFQFINDPPSVAVTPSMEEFTEGIGPVRVYATVEVLDEDNQYLVSAVLNLTAFDGEMEVLSVSPPISGSILAEYDTTKNTLTLLGNDTLQAYSDVLSTLTYDHLTDQGSPTAGIRALTLTVSDGLDSSIPVEVLIPFTAVNDPPIVYLREMAQNFAVSFLEDLVSRVAITSPSANIVDVDNTSLVAVVVTLLNPMDGHYESLEAYGNDNVMVVLDSPLNNTLRLLPRNSLQTAPIPDLVAALATVHYVNTKEEPTAGLREIEVVASDGLEQSAPSYALVTINAQNDPPVLDLNGPQPGTGFETTFYEESVGQNITSLQVTIMDNDVNSTVTKIYITICNATDGSSEVVFSSLSEMIVSPPTVNNATSTNVFIVYVPPSLSPQLNAVDILESLVYRNLKLEPAPGERQIKIYVSDGEDVSNTAVTVLTVVTINDNQPVFVEQSLVSSIVENGAAGESVRTVLAVDADSGEDGDVIYEIVGGDPNGRFEINMQTGEITTASALDRENASMYTLEVVAIDLGTPQMSSAVNAAVEVRVLDLNDVIPTIVTPPQLSVSEGASIGTTVETLMTMDNDLGENGAFVYTLLEGQDIPFTFSTGDGRILVAEALDADTEEGVAVYTLTVMVEDLGNPPLSSQQQFFITVTNENEFAPVLQPQVVNLTLPEDLHVQSSVLNISAVDGDTGPNGDVEFEFADPVLYDTFSIDSVTGEIRTVAELDYESQPSYLVTILAVDQGINRRTASSTVYITIEDVNDNHPQFVGVPITGEVAENSPPLTTVLQVAADDRDTGNNSQLTFSFVNATSEFTIDPLSGTVTVVQSLDFEVTQMFTLVVRVVDQGEPPLSNTTEVVINVMDENDNAPQFAQDIFEVDIQENQLGDLLLDLTVVDADSGTNALIQFHLIDDFSGTFFVNTFGQLFVHKALDFEMQCQYNLTMVATDRGVPPLTGSTQILVSVVNIGDVAPVFNSSTYWFNVPENEPSGWEVGRVAAFDGDGSNCTVQDTLDEVLIYSLIDNTGVFVINETTGVISTAASLDREETEMYSFTVEVRDSTGRVGRATVHIMVQDRNDLPPVFNPSHYEVATPESTPIGDTVLQLSADDGDSLDEGKLSFSLEAVPSLPFTVSSTGAIIVSARLDYEDVLIYNFSAFVTDTVGNTDTAQVVITVTDSAEIPPSVSGIDLNQIFTEGDEQLFLYENLTITDDDVNHQTLHRAVVELSTPEDENTGADCQCVASCPNTCLEFLQINQSVFPGQQVVSFRTITLTGVYPISVYIAALRTVQYVNTLANPSPRIRSVRLTVFDETASRTLVVVNISLVVFNQFAPVLDGNGPNLPGINFMTNFTEEGMAVPIVSSTAFLSDADTLNSVPQLTSLTVLLANPLDLVAETLSSLPGPLPEGISCSLDSSGHVRSCTGTASHSAYVSVLSMIRYENTALEPNPTPRTILLTPAEYHLSSNSTTTVNIVTINDHHPYFSYLGQGSNSFTTYLEDSTGVPVLGPTGQIIDEDSGNDAYANNLWVELIDPAGTDRIFIADPSVVSSLIQLNRVSPTHLLFSGVANVSDYENILRQTMYTSTLTEFETLETKTVQLYISDISSRQSSVTTITFMPVNDNLPVFLLPEYTFDVSESAALGEVIGAVSATDADTVVVASIVYSIVNSSTIAEIDPSTGTLTLNGELDYETATQHAFHVQALDAAFTGPLPPNQVRVVVQVQDVNDNSPVFEQAVYNDTVEEGVPLDTPIVTVSAVDADGPSHSTIVYQILGSLDFKIHNSSGVISTDGVIDHEAQNLYNLTVVASNPGSNLSSSATVIIEVLDVDDNVPEIILSPQSKNITEIPNASQLATTLSVELSITDQDPNPSLSSANVSIAPSYAGTGVLLTAESSSGISIFGNGTKVVQFEGLRSVVAYQQVLRQVSFYDATEEPVAGVVNIHYQVFTPGSSPVPATFVLSVQVINDNAPVLRLDTRDTDDPTFNGVDPTIFGGLETVQLEGAYFTTFVEDGPPVPLSHQSLTLMDQDSETTVIMSAVVYITDAQDTGLEEVTVELSQGVELGPNSTAMRLNLDGPVSLSAMAAVLRTVR